MALTLRRRLGEKVMLADEHGRWAFAPETLEPADSGPLAREDAPRLLASWPGPAKHLVLLERGGVTMGLDEAKSVVDFAFKAPGPVLIFELEPGAGGSSAWSAASFIFSYAERKGEWSKRSVAFTVRVRAEPPGPQAELLARHHAEIRFVADASEPPKCPRVHRVLLTVGKGAQDPAGWVRAIAASGAASALLHPAAPDVPAFAAFYEKALDAFLGQESLFEERAAGFLSGKRWRIPGYDVLSELAYGSDGMVFTAEGGLPLGYARNTLYHELNDSQIVQACLAAALPDNQPRCASCVYRAYCAVPPSLHEASQGTLWGRTPESPWCAVHMAVLDAVFTRLSDEKSAPALRRWGADKIGF